MRKELFEELLASVREGGAILWGKQAPSREHFFELADGLASTRDPEEPPRVPWERSERGLRLRAGGIGAEHRNVLASSWVARTWSQA